MTPEEHGQMVAGNHTHATGIYVCMRCRVEKVIRAAIKDRDQEWYDRLRDEGMNFGDSQPPMDKFVIALKGLIAVAGWNNVNEEREACAKVLEDAISEYCDRHATAIVDKAIADKRFCDMYGCHDLRRLVAAIRARGEK